MTRPEHHGLIPRTAYYLGVALRVSADAIAYPYRRLRRPQARDNESARPRWRHEHALPARGLTVRTRPAPSVERRRSRPDRAALPVEAARMAADEGLLALSAALTDPEPEVRIVALQTLGELEGEQAGRMLADVLHDPDPQVRVAAAGVAARVRATTVVFSLILALDDPEPEVRDAAARALESITGEQIDIGPDDAPEARRALIEELKRWWKARRLSELSGPSVR